VKIVIFGATGGTGRQLVEQGIAVGHEVTAVARNPVAISLRHPCLKVAQGDVLQPETVERAVTGADAVISSLGVHSREPTVVYSQGIANIMRAMRQAGIQRLIGISASGLDPGPLWQRVIFKPLLWWAFKEGYSDMVRMENEIRTSGLKWTIVRPPRLTDGARTGQYISAVNKHLTRGSMISRADLAEYTLKLLTDPASYGALIEVAH
jgi:putative NADH-flavin reductase